MKHKLVIAEFQDRKEGDDTIFGVFAVDFHFGRSDSWSDLPGYDELDEIAMEAIEKWAGAESIEEDTGYKTMDPVGTCWGRLRILATCVYYKSSLPTGHLPIKED